MPAFKFNLFCDMSCVSSCTQQWYYGSHFMFKPYISSGDEQA